MKLELVFFTCFFAVAFGALFQTTPSTHPDHPGKCWLKEYKVAVKPGETFAKIGKCVAYRCREDFSIQGASCGTMSVEPPCYISEQDNTKLHPHCCPTVACP